MFILTRTFSSPRVRPVLFVQLVITVSACSLFCFTSSLRGQEPAQTVPSPIQATTEIVKIEASVLDRHGSFVSGLTKANFRILDDGVEQPIAFFAPVEAPLPAPARAIHQAR